MVGTDVELIMREVNYLLSNPEHYRCMSEAHNPYGDGLASLRILTAIKNEFS